MNIKMLKQQAEKYARKSKTARKPHIKAAWQKLYQDVMADIASIERANTACNPLAPESPSESQVVSGASR